MSEQCVVCGGADVVSTLERHRLPAMQNYVYRSRDAAVHARDGRLTIAVCRDCGFAWNSQFDPGRLVYDSGYDNAVRSGVMDAHYRAIAGLLASTHALDGGLVVDVGCGNGAFLKTLCREVPQCRGLGIDPALEEDWQDDEGRVRLVKDTFRADLIDERPALVTCRHVLEHLPRPVEFVREIREAIASFDELPVYFEVPDLRWIIRNEAFQDFCYEHCNYFTAANVGEVLDRAGFELVSTRSVFNGQYLLVEARTPAESRPHDARTNGDELADAMVGYAQSEGSTIVSIRERLQGSKIDGRPVAVWGMATKGVVFSLLVDPERSLIDFCIDINTNKQGSFVPLTGHEIRPPSVLGETADGRSPLVVVMNENYRDEVEQACREMGIEATFVGPNAT